MRTDRPRLVRRLEELPRLLRTVRHLRPSQVAWRLRYAWERRRPSRAELPSMPHDARVAEPLPNLPRFQGPDAGDAQTLALLEHGHFEHLQERKTLGPPAVDWRLGDRTQDRLWAITLHYHRWVDRLACAAQDDRGPAEAQLAAYLGDWLDRCGLHAPGARALAWNSFAIATRLGWWARAYRTLRHTGWKHRFPELHARWLQSAWGQAAYLESHLEWDLRANHLLRDAIGLLWAGRWFDHPVAKRWLALGTELALDQAKEQILADGGHFERSPMYQIHVFEDLLSAMLLVPDQSAKASLRAACDRMTDAIAWMRHPDGEIPLLGDAAIGAVSPPGDALQIAADHGVEADTTSRSGTRHFLNFGLVVHHGPRWSVFFDVGEVGPAVQPGHAHADTLSVTASLHGVRLLVDPGTYGYDHDDRRQYDRSTAAHNTVTVAGENSSEVWHIFRVGRRAELDEVRVARDRPGLDATASHHGYAHLPGSPVHTRSVVCSGDTLALTDVVQGSGQHEIAGGLLFGPGWALQRREARIVAAHPDAGEVHIDIDGPPGLDVALTGAPYHPGYGRESTSARLAWSVSQSLPCRVHVRLCPV